MNKLQQRLREVFLAASGVKANNGDVDAGISAVIAELAKTDIADVMPTVDEMATTIAATKPTRPSERGIALVSLRVAPIIASLREHVKVLEHKLWNQRQALELLNNAQRDKNIALDAMHYVWCDGGCPGGAHRFTDKPITAEIVAEAMRNTTRLVRWFVSSEGRKVPTDWDSRSAAWDKARGDVLAALVPNVVVADPTKRAEIVADHLLDMGIWATVGEGNVVYVATLVCGNGEYTPRIKRYSMMCGQFHEDATVRTIVATIAQDESRRAHVWHQRFQHALTTPQQDAQ